MAAPDPIVKIIRPQLTPEERAARIEEIKKAVCNLYVACIRNGIEWKTKEKESGEDA